MDQRYGTRTVRREVSTNVFTPVGSQTLTAAQTHRIPIWITERCTDLQLSFGNFGTSSTPVTEFLGAPVYTVAAAIEIGGTIRKLSFDGATTATINGGGVASTDPIGFGLTPGLYWLRVYNSATGTGWAVNARSNNNGGGSATGDLTAAGSATITSGDFNQYGPFSISGVVSTAAALPSAFLAGDSIMAGENDNNGVYTNNDWSGAAASGTASATNGFVTRGIGKTVGRINSSIASTTAAVAATDGRYLSKPLSRYCTHAISNLAINDISAGATLAVLQANLISFWTSLANRGLKVFHTTCTPPVPPRPIRGPPRRTRRPPPESPFESRSTIGYVPAHPSTQLPSPQ